MSSSAVPSQRGVEREVERACRTSDDAVALHRSAFAALSSVVPVDSWCSITLDPATVLETGGFHEQGLPPARIPRLLDIEHGDDDVNAFRTLARAPRPVSTLARATAGDPARSARWREVLQPSGVHHELRVVLRADGAAWGGLVLMRAGDRPDFSDDELALVERLSALVARGTRRALALATVRSASDDDTGVLLLRPTPEGLDVVHASDGALRWLADVEEQPVGSTGVPVSVRGLVASVRDPSSPARCRVRTRSGRWLTLRAEQTSDGTVAVIVTPSRPAEVAAVLADAAGLTARECEVVLLVARGLSTAEIARALWLSPHTVQDHLKKVFERVGVRTRGELTSRLFVDHYLPRVATGAEPGWDGWFVGR